MMVCFFPYSSISLSLNSHRRSDVLCQRMSCPPSESFGALLGAMNLIIYALRPIAKLCPDTWPARPDLLLSRGCRYQRTCVYSFTKGCESFGGQRQLACQLLIKTDGNGIPGTPLETQTVCRMKNGNQNHLSPRYP